MPNNYSPNYYADARFGSLDQALASPNTGFNAEESVAIAGLAGGGYALVFEVSNQFFVRIHDSNGMPIGDPILIASDLTLDLDIVGTPDGGFFIVYPVLENNASGPTYLLTGQFFDPHGNSLGEAFTVIEGDRIMQQVDVSVLENGDLALAWSANTNPNSVRGLIVSPSGEARGESFSVSSVDGATNFFYPQIDALADGSFVASWASNNDVFAQVFSSSGEAIGPIVSPQPAQEFIRNTYQSVAALPDGNYMIVWNENLSGFEPSRVIAAVYAPDGTEVVAQFRVDSSDVYEIIQPDVELLADGTLLVTWSYRVPGEGPNFFQIGEIRAQLVSASGQLLGEEFQVDDGSDLGQHFPLIASFGTGDAVIAWTNYTEGQPRANVQLRNLYSVTDGDANSNTMNGTAGVDFLRALEGVDYLTGGLGDDSIDGGSDVDTAIFSSDRADYTVTQISTGVFEVAGPDGTDTLTNIEYLQFDDGTERLLRGSGVSVTFETADPSVYQSAMDAIRDFDGNALGGNGSWLRIGSADINGDGDIDQILVNDAIGRFATVGTQGGLVYFDDYSWAGETRVAGIYIDPLVESGDVEAGSDNDSQRRFQNDLQIENINRVLGADDYDGDGVWEVYFALTDGTAYLRALMHEDGNIRYANYQSEQEVIDYLTANGYDESTFGDWFPAATGSADTVTFVNEAPKVAEVELLERPEAIHARIGEEWQAEYYG